jgi:starch phosphorylase
MANPPAAWRFFTEHDQGMDAASIKRSFASHVEYTQGKDEHGVTRLDFYQSLARTVRDRLVDRWNATQQRYYTQDARRVYYLSLEFLLGRLTRDGLLNLGILDEARAALAELEIDLDEVLEAEPDAGLGNGGLGRLAACFLDSMATLGIPAMGYGIRYEYGIFRQIFSGGRQLEEPDSWLRFGCPWEIPRPESVVPVQFYGRVETRMDSSGRVVFDWVDAQVVMAMAYDLLVPGYRAPTVNTLRLWSAKAARELKLWNFHQGDYVSAVNDKNATEDISRVLYPSDSTAQGRELRLKQEFFFVSATLQDAIRRHLKTHRSLADLHEKAVFQMNDTHPAMAVAELMRLLVDVHLMGWDEAWATTTRCMAYTNHTVLVEALERWPVPMLERLLPRHLQIIYEINSRFLAAVAAIHPRDADLMRRLSLVDEGAGGEEKTVRMAHLAVVGSSSVNGVSELHARILRERTFPGFAELWPERFNSKTNGITPRRWLLGCNPGLAALITSRIGDRWVRDLEALEALEPLADDPEFRAEFRAVKQGAKARLARLVADRCDVAVDPASLFDVQIKRIHEYKRQLLNALHLYSVYLRITREGPAADEPPRTAVFAGKAAPGYAAAKLIVRLVNAVADRVNSDPAVRDHLRVVFVPNYDVSLAEAIVPAADLSEQISTAGTEASGTGNMKLALNGALTIGTLDGANIEIAEAVGLDNLFIFGLTEPEVSALRARGYDPQVPFRAQADLRNALESVADGELSPDDRRRFMPLVSSLLYDGDAFMVLADFAAYRECQRDAGRAFLLDVEGWTRKAVLTVARMGRFSSDLTVRRYAEEIWRVPLPGA